MMTYLSPLIKRMTDDEHIISQCSSLQSDEEILNVISSEIPYSKINEVFERYYGLEYKSLSKGFNEDLMKNFDLEFLKKESTLPYSFEDDVWLFVISDLTDRNSQMRITNEVLKNEKGSVKFAFSFKHEIEKIHNRLSRNELVVSTVSPSNAIEWVEEIIGNGIELKASDIHIESVEEGIQVRYRVDGSLMDKQVFNVNDNEASNIYVRIKLIGDMDISEKRRSQDGRIDNYVHLGERYSLRISTINTIHGEKFAMRILSEESSSVSFEKLGFTEEQEEQVSNMLKKSNGIVYLAGATGSGKTTTLYAMIDEFDENSLNIYTVENPVEKSIGGVNQVQIDEAHGNTYPLVLETLLRQDPDVLVVGEIRDAETSKLAVQSSLTGHFVMTTIHANNALESITRLSEMGVESYLVGASSVGFISQRLVRVLCSHCKVKVENIPHHEEVWLKSIVEDFDYDECKNNGQYIYKSVGCQECVSGYKGRMAVLEIIEVDDKLREMISRKEESKEMRSYLDETDYKTMKYDGVMKALNGNVSVEELIGKLQN